MVLSPEIVVAVVFTVLVAAGVASLMLVRKLGRSQSLVLASTERLKVRADAAEETSGRLFELTQNAQAISSRIMKVDDTADVIHEKVDIILNAVTGQPAVAVNPGRHARPSPALSAVPDDDQRYIA